MLLFVALKSAILGNSQSHGKKGWMQGVIPRLFPNIHPAFRNKHGNLWDKEEEVAEEAEFG